MRLPEFCIRKPVITIVLNLLLVIVGLFSFFNLEVRVSPSHDIPIIRIDTYYTGASASLIERSVTNVLEQQLSSVPGVQDIRSESTQGKSKITLHLLANANATDVVSKVREVVSRAESSLPNQVDTPVVSKISSMNELAEFMVYSNQMDLSQLMDYTNLNIKPKLQAVNDVADIEVWGQGDREMQININPSKLAAKGVSISELKNAITSANVALPGGQVRSTFMNYPVNINTRLDLPEQYKNIVINQANNRFIHVRDVANVKLGTTADAASIFFNDKQVIYINVDPMPNANVINAYQQLTHRIKQLSKQLPKGTHLINAFDEIKYLIASIHEVYYAIAFAIICVLIVVFLFLGDWRSVIIPFLSIPISLAAAFFLMKIGGLSINQFTLLAMVLAVGLVVDDAIVVVENVQRHQRKGLPAMQAAIIGSNEIVFPIIAMTITLVAVYLPIALITGRYASIYLQFAVTLAASVLFSGWVSLSLSPMMCAYSLKNRSTNLQCWSENWLNRLSSHYKTCLRLMLQHRTWVGILLILLIVSGSFAYRLLNHEIAPGENYGILMTSLNLQEGANISATEKQSEKVAHWLNKRFPNYSIFRINSPTADNTAYVNVLTPPGMKNPVNFLQELPTIQKGLQQIPGARISATVPNAYSNAHNAPIDFYITSSGSFHDLQQQANQIIEHLKHSNYFNQPHTDLMFNSQQYDIKVNYDLTSDLGISNQSINDTLNTIFGSNHISDFNYNNQSFDVVLQSQKNFQNNINAINQVMIPAANNQMIPLQQLVTVKPILEQPILRHFNRLRSAEITANLKPGIKLDQAAQFIHTHLQSWLPDGTGYRLSGNLRQLSDSSHNMTFLFLMAIVFIYLLLSMQFGNFIDPLGVMLTVPLCIFGALISLWAIGGSINLYTIIALVTLVGLITKHGILIIQFSNECMEHQKLNPVDAVIEAASIRLRPILMTTSAMTFGALPLVITSGSGAIARQQMGVVVIGGLLCGTFFSLLVVPIAYSHLAQLKLRLHQWMSYRAEN